MEAQTVFELRNVVITALLGLVRDMKPDSAIDAHHDELQIITQTDTRPQSKVFQEIPPFQLPARTIRVLMNQPDIAGIQENRAIQSGKNRETIFQIRLEFQVSGLVYIAILIVQVRPETPRTDASDGKCPDTIGSSDIKLLVIRSSMIFSALP